MAATRRSRKRKRATVNQRRLVDSLIQMKMESSLSQKQLLQVIQKCIGEEADLVSELVQQELKCNGYHAHRLHGCTRCNDFIYGYVRRRCLAPIAKILKVDTTMRAMHKRKFSILLYCHDLRKCTAILNGVEL